MLVKAKMSSCIRYIKIIMSLLSNGHYWLIGNYHSLRNILSLSLVISNKSKIGCKRNNKYNK